MDGRSVDCSGSKPGLGAPLARQPTCRPPRNFRRVPDRRFPHKIRESPIASWTARDRLPCSVLLVPSDRGRCRQRRQVSGLVRHGPKRVADRLLPFSDGVEVAHGQAECPGPRRPVYFGNRECAGTAPECAGAGGACITTSPASRSASARCSAAATAATSAWSCVRRPSRRRISAHARTRRMSAGSAGDRSDMGWRMPDG